MPSNRSRSLTSSTCSSVPIFVPERDSTGVPRVAAWYEIGVPSAIILTPSSASTTILPGSARSGPQARRSRDSAPRERRAETAKLGGRAAQGELVPLGRGEVPVQPVTGVDAHAAVDMDRGVRDPVAGLGRPELGGRDLLVTRQAGLEPPGGLPHRQPDRLDVDVGVGQPLRHRLERPDRPAELLPGPGPSVSCWGSTVTPRSAGSTQNTAVPLRVAAGTRKSAAGSPAGTVVFVPRSRQARSVRSARTDGARGSSPSGSARAAVMTRRPVAAGTAQRVTCSAEPNLAIAP